jgi:hypothetical protein
MHVAAPGVKDPPSVSSVCGNATLAGNQQKALCCPWKGRATQASDGRRSWSSVTPPKPCLGEVAPTAAHCPTLFGLTADDQVDSSSHPAMPNQPLLLTGGPQSRALPRYRGYTHFRCPALGQPFFAADHTPRVHRLTISSGPRICNAA